MELANSIMSMEGECKLTASVKIKESGRLLNFRLELLYTDPGDSPNAWRIYWPNLPVRGDAFFKIRKLFEIFCLSSSMPSDPEEERIFGGEKAFFADCDQFLAVVRRSGAEVELYLYSAKRERFNVAYALSIDRFEIYRWATEFSNMLDQLEDALPYD
jgi:hypothetical protein